MHDKLELLLKQINFEEEKYHYFNEGTLEKIICNKSKNSYVFFLNLKRPLDVMTYLEFNKKLRKKYSKYKLKAKLKINEFNLENIVEYYRYFMEEYLKNAPLLEAFVDSKIDLKDKNLEITILNRAEEMKFNSIKDQLEEKLNDAGFGIQFKLIIDEESRAQVQKEIEMSKTKEIPKIAKN